MADQEAIKLVVAWEETKRGFKHLRDFKEDINTVMVKEDLKVVLGVVAVVVVVELPKYFGTAFLSQLSPPDMNDQDLTT